MPRPVATLTDAPRREADRTRRPYRARVAWRELPAAFHAPRSDEAAIQAMLDRYAASGSEADRGALVTHMLSLVASVAGGPRARGRYPSVELDELVSDGALGVLNVVDHHAHLPADRFRQMVVGAVYGNFAQRLRERTWGGKVKALDGRRKLAVKQRLMRQLRRPPTAAEWADAYAAERAADGPDGANVDRRTRVLLATDQALDDGATQLDVAATRGPTPDVTAADRETMELAMAGLAGDDREMFRLAVEGVPHKDIAARFGLSHQAAYRRVNGLLWQARCRADLARHLGVEPAAFIPHYPDKSERGIGSVPPARLAV
jgi:DNA-directed RNA polymerase specialized sigma subunit